MIIASHSHFTFYSDELQKRHTMYNQRNTKFDSNHYSIEKYPIDFTWKHLYLKLDFENHLIKMNDYPDFKCFYKKIHAFKQYITSLIIPIITVDKIKSGYHYLTALLTHFTCLHHIQIVGCPEHNAIHLSLAGLNCLIKGFNNFMNNGGKLQTLSYHNLHVNNTSESYSKLYYSIQNLIGLQGLTMTNSTMVEHIENKELYRLFSTHNTLIELNLINIALTTENIKEISDGLMKTRQIQKINLTKNLNLNDLAMSPLLYSLVFCNNLKYLKLSDNTFVYHHKDIIEMLCKLIKVSDSLETLDISKLKDMNSKLSLEFFKVIGESYSLKTIDLSYSGKLGKINCGLLGKAIGCNAKKEGLLEHLNLEGEVIRSYEHFKKFYNGMHISNHDYEEWYGYPIKFSNMTDHDSHYLKIFHNNLKSIKLNNSFLHSQFDLNSWNKDIKPKDPELLEFFRKSSKLEDVQMKLAKLQKNDGEALFLAFDPGYISFSSQIKILNLSRNNIGKIGAKALANALKFTNVLEVLDISTNKLGILGAQYIAQALCHNTSLKYLNLFANNIGIEGARSFAKTLSTNSTLEFIDLGHNRLRDKGILSLARGLSENDNPNIQHLGLRFNFLTEDGIKRFLRKFCNCEGETSLKRIYIRNNMIDNKGIFEIAKMVKRLEIELNMDILEKLKYLDSNLLEKTIWKHGEQQDFEKFKYYYHPASSGIVMDIRQRSGPKLPNRKKYTNMFYFIEYMHSNNSQRKMRFWSKSFKAGTSTYIRMKRRRPKASRYKDSVFEIKAKVLKRKKCKRIRKDHIEKN